MIHQRLKDLAFTGTFLYSFLSYPLLKIKFRKSKDLFLHIGCGKNKIPGFINIDGNPFARKDTLYDVRVKLPFNDSSVKIIYTGGTLEHFYTNELLAVLREFYRTLQKDGILRIVVPDLEKSILAYVKGDSEFFIGFPRNFTSVGGKFVNFIFCEAQHKIAFDYAFMKELLNGVGFEKVSKVGLEQSFINKKIYNNIKPFEEYYKNNSLFVEAIK